MAEGIIYADLNIAAGKHRRNRHSIPQPGTSGCPRWHRTALWAGWTGNFLLGVTVVAIGCSLLGQQTENPGSVEKVNGSVGGCNTTLEKTFSDLRQFLCPSKPQEDGGCKLCPVNWMLRGTKCYWASDGIGSWSSSRDDCVNRGATLLMPADQDELGFLNYILRRPTRYFWIGLSLPSIGKGWTWLNGSRLDQSRFPLNPWGKNGSCGVAREGTISSTSCSSALQWICQKEATQL